MHGQQVTISTEINMRSDRAFHLIGEIEDHFLLYRELNNEKKLMIYDTSLVLQSERQINLINSDKSIVFELINMDSTFGVFYGYYKEDEEILQLDIFDSGANLRDSIEILREERDKIHLRYNVLFSDDQSKIAFYNFGRNDNLRVIVYDINERDILHNNHYNLLNTDFEKNFVEARLSNRGSLFLLTEYDNSRSSKSGHEAFLYHFKPGVSTVDEIVIPLHDMVTSPLFLSIDNLNNGIGLAALYDDKKHTTAKGYVWVYGQIDQWSDLAVIQIPLDPVIAFDLYGEKNRYSINYFTITDVIYKINGEALLIMEMQQDQVRSNATTRGQGLYGWQDHFREDLVVMNISKTGEMRWHKVCYKKQFSQNDGGVYSSYFPFITPSRLHLVFNDEISLNSTVSDYVFDGFGNFKRTSLMSTEYQNLLLRLQDAVQISSSSLLIPSIKNNSFHLVKLNYSQ